MASQGYALVRHVHRDSLVKQYRRLLGERKFWADRRHHPRATAELARLNAAIDALSNALPLIAPDVVLAEMRPLLFHLAVPLPGHAMKRAALASLRNLSKPTLDELAAHIAKVHCIDLELHDIGRLSQRTRKVLDGLVARGSIEATPAQPFRWFLNP